jgi:hypothetical protein
MVLPDIPSLHIGIYRPRQIDSGQDPGSGNSCSPIEYSRVFDGVVDLGSGLVFITHNSRCLIIFLITSSSYTKLIILILL